MELLHWLLWGGAVLDVLWHAAVYACALRCAAVGARLLAALLLLSLTPGVAFEAARLGTSTPGRHFLRLHVYRAIWELWHKHQRGAAQAELGRWHASKLGAGNGHTATASQASAPPSVNASAAATMGASVACTGETPISPPSEELIKVVTSDWQRLAAVTLLGQVLLVVVVLAQPQVNVYAVAGPGIAELNVKALRARVAPWLAALGVLAAALASVGEAAEAWRVQRATLRIDWPLVASLPGFTRMGRPGGESAGQSHCMVQRSEGVATSFSHAEPNASTTAPATQSGALLTPTVPPEDELNTRAATSPPQETAPVGGAVRDVTTRPRVPASSHPRSRAIGWLLACVLVHGAADAWLRAATLGLAFAAPAAGAQALLALTLLVNAVALLDDSGNPFARFARSVLLGSGHALLAELAQDVLEDAPALLRKEVAYIDVSDIREAETVGDEALSEDASYARLAALAKGEGVVVARRGLVPDLYFGEHTREPLAPGARATPAHGTHAQLQQLALQLRLGEFLIYLLWATGPLLAPAPAFRPPPPPPRTALALAALCYVVLSATSALLPACYARALAAPSVEDYQPI